MKYLISLDYTTLVNAGKSIEKQLSDKDLRIKNLEEQLKPVQESQKELQNLNEKMNSMKEQVDQRDFVASFFHKKNVQNII
jgi:lipid A disaccharide synthetase